MLLTCINLTVYNDYNQQYIIMANIGITFPNNQRSYEGRGTVRNMAIISGMKFHSR